MHEPILSHVACDIGYNVALNEINLRLSVVPSSTEFLCDCFDEVFLFDFEFLIVLLQCELTSEILAHHSYHIDSTVFLGKKEGEFCKSRFRCHITTICNP